MASFVNKTSLVSFRIHSVTMALCAVSLWLCHDSPANAAQIRWDLINLDFDTFVMTPGGTNTAKAADDSKIAFTGSGFFDPEVEASATGDGTWITFSPPDEEGIFTETGRGTYTVSSLLAWTPLVGTTIPNLTDEIGNLEDTRAGLVLLQIDYSDGSTGSLFVSCALRGADPKTPLSIFEGITAGKGSVGYSTPDYSGPAGVFDNLTMFHVPEPSTMALALCFLPVLGLCRRMRRS